jgi:hypothetical protein
MEDMKMMEEQMKRKKQREAADKKEQEEFDLKFRAKRQRIVTPGRPSFGGPKRNARRTPRRVGL